MLCTVYAATFFYFDVADAPDVGSRLISTVCLGQHFVIIHTTTPQVPEPDCSVLSK